MAATKAGFTDISALPGLTSLWAKSQGDPRICVAVLDGPVDQSHPCFEGANLTRLPTLVSDVASSGLMSGHGTHITSTIFGQHHSSVRGIAPGCRGLIVPVFSDDRRRGSLSQLDLARAINQAVEGGANVINISGGQLSQSGEADPILAKAVKFCNDEGVLIVAAAGNDACRCLHVPAALPAVLAVGAMNAEELPFDFSNWGDIYQTQGILAPGENILGAEPGGGITTKNGTSFAAPIVSGIIALLLSIQLQQGNQPNPHIIRDVILKSALSCNPKELEDCRRFLAGKINIPGAYTLITKGGNNQVPKKSLPAAILPSNESSDSVAEIANQPSEASNFPLEIAANQLLDPSVLPAEVTASQITSTPIQHEGNAMNSASTQVVASGDCGCQTGNVAPAAIAPSNAPASFSLIYALGVVGYDFATEARRDSFKQLMPLVRSDNYEPVEDRNTLPDGVFPIPANPYDARQMAKYLEKNPSEAESLIWTLNLELTPIYAILPQGAYASTVYQRLAEFLQEQVLIETNNDYIERVSIPALITGRTIQLFSGQIVPVVEPINIRGMYGWKINSLIQAVLAQIATETERGKIESSLRNFLSRVYYDLRNLGQTSQERALNFASTNVFQYADILSKILVGKNVVMQLNDINVVRSPFCRKDSDCWDVKLKFFDPENERRANRVLRYTIDVSDIMPVTLGIPRQWDEPGYPV